MSGKPKKHHHEEHEEHVNHEAWVIPYADMLTLLMAMFLVLWAIGQVDTKKAKAVSTGFADEFGLARSAGAGAGGVGVMDGSNRPEVSPAPEKKAKIDKTASIGPKRGAGGDKGEVPNGGAGNQTSPGAGAGAGGETPGQLVTPGGGSGSGSDKAQMTGEGKAVAGAIEQAAAANAVGPINLEVHAEQRGLVVSIVSEGVLFESGSANLTPYGRLLLASFADKLKALPNQLRIEGHTDSSPISTAQFPSNWELSGARATSVLRYLISDFGIPPGRFSGATGYGDSKPVADNKTDGGRKRNRRVDIAILSEDAAAKEATAPTIVPPKEANHG